MIACFPFVLSALLFAATAAQGQVAAPGIADESAEEDSRGALGTARSAQVRFEQRRTRYLPRTFDSYGGECDERVGRFCTWYDEGEWVPEVEDPEIGLLRQELLALLDSVQVVIPADGWVLGQRVWYRGERGDWPGALEVARECGPADPWWCLALQGFALHGSVQYDASMRAFEGAFSAMDPERAEDWRQPASALDGGGRDLLERAEKAGQPAVDELLWRLWTLADPLYLVAGNDRRTEHYARRVVSLMRENARNPFHTRWGDDLEELTVRHGWELGWERVIGPSASTADHVVGHKHPQGRDYLPRGVVLADPRAAAAEDLVAGRREPRSLYAPPYAPVLLPMDGQVARFPHGPAVTVVVTYALPEDTTRHAGHDHARPWMEARDQEDLADRAGLFLVPLDGGAPRERRTFGAREGSLLLRADPGAYIISAEVWSPRMRRAGRLRSGFQYLAAQEDVAVLSDLLMVAPVGGEPESLEEAASRALPRPAVAAWERFAIVWEVSGLGFRPETLDFQLSVARTDRGVLRRFGELVRVVKRLQPLTLAWAEPGPAEPGTSFHYLDLDVPELGEGEYEIRLTLRTPGRSEVVAVRPFTVSRE